MGVFVGFITLGVLLHLVSCDVSHIVNSNNAHVKSAEADGSKYNPTPRGYEYSGAYSTVAPEYRGQYVQPTSKSSYNSYPSGQVSPNQNYYSAKQEYSPEYQNDRGVLLISKELRVPFAATKVQDNSDFCDQTHINNVNQQTQIAQESQPNIKTSNYEVRRPGVRKEFFDIEEKVVIKPAGTAIFELEHDKPHSSAIVSKHIQQQQQTSPSQYSDEETQYFPQEQPYAYSHENHGYNPYIIQTHHHQPSVPATDFNYNPIFARQPPYTRFPPNPIIPVYPSTTVTPEYLPPPKVDDPPCDDSSSQYPPYTPHTQEFSHEHNEETDAEVITPQQNQVREDNKEFVDVKYAPDNSNSNREREYYRAQTSNYNVLQPKIDRVRNEYKNERGDLAQQKVIQHPEQFHHEYVPNVNQKQVQIRPNGVPLAKYSEQSGSNQVEIENSRRLLDLYSANGDVTEIGFNGNARSQQYQAPNSNARARVVSVTPAPIYANYVDEQTKSRRVALSKPLYTVQQVEVREHSHRFVEDVHSDSSVEPKISEFEKLRILGNSVGKSSSEAKVEDYKQQVEYVTPVPQNYAQLRAGSPVPETLQK